jgi:hypothetical protein
MTIDFASFTLGAVSVLIVIAIFVAGAATGAAILKKRNPEKKGLTGE